MEFLPQRLKECREKADMTVEQLLVSLHNLDFPVARNTLLNWEGGKTAPDTNDLAIIASFYKKPIQYFFVHNTK